MTATAELERRAQEVLQRRRYSIDLVDIAEADEELQAIAAELRPTLPPLEKGENQ